MVEEKNELKKMTTILYLTDRWPHPPGESFISNEIRDLSPYFDNIMILPTTMEKLNESHKILPSNCEVLVDIHTKIIEKWNQMGFVSRLFNGMKQKGVVKEILSSKPFSPKEVVGEAAQIKIACDLIEMNMGTKLNEIDAVVSFWLNRGGSIAAELGRRHRIAAISRGHGGDIYSERRKRKHLPMQKQSLKNLDVILPDSEAGVIYLKNKYPEISKKIKVGRLGVDEQNAASKSNDQRLHVISVSSLVPVKRVHLIASALCHTKRKIKWTHLGGGDTINLIEKQLTNIGENVEVCLKGQVSHADVLNWFENNSVDVFVNVSSSEGLPVSIMEAFSFGVPVVATKVGGIPEIVDEKCGILIPKEFEPKELGYILENWDGNEMRGDALMKQREEYSSTNNQKDFSELIKKLVK